MWLAGGFVGGCRYNLLLKKYAAMACLGLFSACFSASFRSGGRQRVGALPSVQLGAKLVLALMYAMQSIELIAKFLKDRLGAEREQVVESAVLVDLGVDSLMLAELMFEAEDNLGISIDSDVEIPKTVGEMVQLLDGLLAAKASAA